MKTWVLVVCLLAFPAALRAQDQVVGLLSLPEVFGAGACDKFAPGEIALHAAPESEAVIGSIQVDRYWTFHAMGGCEGLIVNVHMSGTHSVSELPTREFAYAAPAAIVLQRRGRWFKVRLGDGAAWLQASQQDDYFPLEELFTDRLTYVTDASDGHLAASPGATREAGGDSVASGRHVRVGEFHRAGDQLWVYVEVLSDSICESTGEPEVTARGWMPAHAASGEPTIWFSSRGC